MTTSGEAFLLGRGSALLGLGTANLITQYINPYPTFSVGFGAIPQAFNNLFIIGKAKSASTASSYIADTLNVQFNGVTSATYNWCDMFNNGGSTFGGGYSTAQTMIRVSALWTSFSSNTAGAGTFVLWIPNYSNSNFTKSIWCIGYASDGTTNGAVLGMYGGTLSGTEGPVRSLKFFATSGSQLTAGAYFGLYGA
jgi:hypothetical protein